MKGYRTLLLNLGIAVLGVLATFNWSEGLPVKYAALGVVATAAANFGLRFLTDTAVGEAK